MLVVTNVFSHTKKDNVISEGNSKHNEKNRVPNV